jgi:hypothetical protein
MAAACDRSNQNLCRRRRGERAIEVPRGVACLDELVGVTQPAGYARPWGKTVAQTQKAYEKAKRK